MTCPSTSQIDEFQLETRLLEIYSNEVKQCDDYGQSTQHIGDEWMRREIRKLCGFDVSDRWIKLFRKKYNIRYFSGRRHSAEKQPQKETESEQPRSRSGSFLKERRVLRTSRKEYTDIDQLVNEEIKKRQSAGERLTNPWIREYALEMAAKMYPDRQDVMDHFNGNWLYRFKRHYNVELKPRTPETPLLQPMDPPKSTDTDITQEYKQSMDYYQRMLILRLYSYSTPNLEHSVGQ